MVILGPLRSLSDMTEGVYKVSPQVDLHDLKDARTETPSAIVPVSNPVP